MPLETTRKYLEKLFGKYGAIEKVWFRSLALEHDSKIPMKAKIIKNQYGEQKDNKNAYVLFKSKDDAVKATAELNQAVVGDKHIRVDLDGEAEKNDFETTIFIGNLPWVVNEEELRAQFESAGKILNVRVIRDKETFIGKGIAYIQFSTTAEMKVALDTKNNLKFKGRELRVKRATPVERREKKETKKREAKQLRKEDGRDKKVRHHRKHDKPETEADKVEADKEIKSIEPFVKHSKKGISTSHDNIDLSSKIVKRGKKDKQKVAEELLESRDGKTSRAKKFQNKVLLPQITLNQYLKNKREKHAKNNKIKYNKIKIKRAVQ